MHEHTRPQRFSWRAVGAPIAVLVSTALLLVTSVPASAADSTAYRRKPYVRDSRFQNIPPETTVSAPAQGSTAPATSVTTLAGSASDDREVASVRVAVKNTVTGLWLGQSGQWGSWTTLDADLGSAGSPSTGWSRPVTLAPGAYQVIASAVDASGSTDSTWASSTFTAADLTPPSSPSGLAATVSGTSVSLSWAASSDNIALASYEVWRDGSRAHTGTDTAWTDTGLAGGSHSYHVVALDTSGNVSAPSNTAVVSIGSGSGTTVPQRSATPYTALWTEVNNSGDAKAVNQLTGQALESKLADLTRWFTHFHGEGSNVFSLGDPSRVNGGSTLAEKLAARGAMVSNYRNGSYVSQANSGQLLFGEAADLETRAPLAIGTWWPGRPSTSGTSSDPASRLSSGLGTTESTVTLTSAASHKPSGAPNTWPFVPSRGTGAAAGNVTSQNTHDFVSWVRVDDEIMRVRAVSESGGIVTLTVDRGYFGTAPTSHTQGARVMAPVYIGSSTATTFDTGLAGGPNVDSTQKALRYGIKIWQDASSGAMKDGIGWIAGRIEATFSAGRYGGYTQGYNTVWLDVSSCSTYNNADSLGQPIAPWHEPSDRPADSTIWSNAQIQKFNGLKARFPGMQFTANNLASQGSYGDACRDAMMATGGIAGYVLEHWLQQENLWSAQVEQSFRIQANNWPAIYWVKIYEQSGGLTVDQYKRLAYGSFLLTKQPGANRQQFGMNWGVQKPDDLFFWDFGAPQGSPTKVADLEKLNCGGTNVYRRNFSKGFVLVNTSGQTVTCTLGVPAWNVLAPNSNGDPTSVTQVTIAKRDAAFLLTQ